MRRLGLCLLLCLSCSPAWADDDAPFGLRWGESVAEAIASGAKGDVSRDDDQMETLAARMLPDMPPSTDIARLSIDARYGLQRVVWVSKTIVTDDTGDVGRALYQQMKSGLETLYGPPKSSDEEINPAARAATFYHCLAQDGCASFVSIWRTASTDIRMRLVGTNTGEGWLEILFFGPDWSDVMAARRAAKH